MASLNAESSTLVSAESTLCARPQPRSSPSCRRRSDGSLAVTNSTATITSAEENSIGVALGTTWYTIDPTTNQGSVSFHSVGLLGTDGVTRFGSVEGTLPGDLTVELNGLQPGGEGGELTDVVSLSEDGVVTVPPLLNSAMGQVFTDAEIGEFLATIAAGTPGLFGLQLTTNDQAFTLTAMNVAANQDVYLQGQHYGVPGLKVCISPACASSLRIVRARRKDACTASLVLTPQVIAPARRRLMAATWKRPSRHPAR